MLSALASPADGGAGWRPPNATRGSDGNRRQFDGDSSGLWRRSLRQSSNSKEKETVEALKWEYLRRAVRATFSAGLLGMGFAFHPLPKCPQRRANPWVQDLCKHPSVLPDPTPPKVHFHKIPLVL